MNGTRRRRGLSVRIAAKDSTNVMARLDRAIHADLAAHRHHLEAWMAGSSPAMTTE
jgi:hypothetical protein